MTTFSEDRREREIEAYRQFRRLWETDDQSWLDQRRQNWLSSLKESESDPHTIALGNFYVTGEEPRSANRGEIRFEFLHRISYTPFQSTDQLREFWHKTLEFQPAGSRQKHEAFQYIDEVLDRFPERDAMVKLVTETMFAAEFFLYPIEGPGIKSGTHSTIDPRDFVIGYSGLYSFYSEGNRHEWDYRNFSYDYFDLSVQHCEENNRLTSPRHLKALPNMYKFLLELDDANLSPYRLELKQRLIDIARDSNASELLRGALARVESKRRR